MKRYRLFTMVVALLLNFMLIFQGSVVYGSSKDSIRLESLEKEIWEMARELSLSTYQGFLGKVPES
ncbi:MAG: glucan biosynthesis protein D, partial [Acetomicrobium sp.]